MDLLFYIAETFWAVFGVIFIYWWIWLPLILVVTYCEAYASYTKQVYLAGLKWVILEIKIPFDAHKSPKAMEQVFAALNAIGGIGDPPENIGQSFKAWRERVFKGKVPDWYSFEIFATGGEIHFYIRCLEQHRLIIESQLFAHYSEIEITPATDYMAQLPADLPDDQFDINGAELGLTKEDIFPIKTYPEFEEESGGKDDIHRIDPLAPLAEAMSLLLLGEYSAVQYLIRSASEKWIKAWIKKTKNQTAIDKLMGREAKPSAGTADKIFAGIESGVSSLTGGTTEAPKEEKKKEDKPFNQLNPGIQEIIKTTEKATAKLQFQVGIRLLYVAKRDQYIKERLSSLTATYKLFSSQALNGFKTAFSPEVKKGFNKAQKTIENKHKLYSWYRTRKFPEKPFVLNTEELTTVFHFPDVSVKTPALPRIEAKKGEAPSGLPIV